MGVKFSKKSGKDGHRDSIRNQNSKLSKFTKRDVFVEELDHEASLLPCLIMVGQTIYSGASEATLTNPVVNPN